ncbi:pentapeptide repeat-containing protein, partial [Pseudomonas syringae]|uniref:pentapeptide repeat-containing protein n=1 Tax=Pseudomonas syringae TaxID=317 RepID=UPI0020B26D02
KGYDAERLRHLTGANFAGAASLGLVFRDCVLRSACLSGISFYKTELSNLDFADADLSDCDFRQSVFINGGSLSMARVINARFDQADFARVQSSWLEPD